MDFNQRAKAIVDQATGEKQKDPIAVELGRRGGLKGGPALAAKLTPEQRQESARRAANARWGNPQLPVKGERRRFRFHWNFYSRTGDATTGSGAGDMYAPSFLFHPKNNPRVQNFRYCTNCGVDTLGRPAWRQIGGGTYVLCMDCAKSAAVREP